MKNAAGRSFTLRHSRTPILDNGSETANAVLQLAQLSKARVDADTIDRLVACVGKSDMKQLLEARPSMPGWMGDVILKIGTVLNG